MNRDFIIKMMKAKKIEYEAVKELMPEAMRDKWEENESKVKEQLKEIAVELFKEEISGVREESSQQETVSKAKKVKVEF